MKILIATDGMNIGGAETHVFTLINELRKKGADVTLISQDGVYSEILKKSGIKHVSAPLNKRDPISIQRSKKILAREMKRADIVHSHTRFTSHLAKSIRGNSHYPKIVTTAHLNFPLFPFGAFAYWGDGTLAVSEDIRKYLEINYAIKKEDVILTKNAIDLNVYQKASGTAKLIIHTSRIDAGRSKTAFLLVSAAKELLRAHSEWRILIVGSGNHFDRLSKAVLKTNEYLGFEGVTLNGPSSDIPGILTYGGIFVGVSRSALEGMAAGLPTIVCGDEGYGGIVNNENFSLLSHTNFCARGLDGPNETALLRDLNILISDSTLRSKLGAFVREKIESLYPAEALARDAISCYVRIYAPPSVCLMGFFGYDNLGDEETLRCAIKALNNVGINDISLLCASKNKSYTGIDPKRIYDRMNLREITLAIEHSDIFILCGGNLMQNETSLRSLLYYEHTIELARRRGKRIYMLSSGFGETRGTLARALVKRGVAHCDFCGCRTSSDLATAIEYNENSRIMPDLCFLLNNENRKAGKSGSFVWIISKKQYVSLDEINEISKKRSLTPIAVNLFKRDDMSAAERIKENGIAVITPRSYDELHDVLSSADFTISERLHGAIFSVISHTPAYISAESGKNQALIYEISKRARQRDIIFPYSKNRVLEKKEIGVRDSDFNYVINSLRLDIFHSLKEIF